MSEQQFIESMQVESASGSSKEEDSDEEFEESDDDITEFSQKTRLNELTQILNAPKSQAKNTTGVLYFSRIPPFMSPKKLRALITQCLSQAVLSINAKTTRHEQIQRIFANPEPIATTQKRKKYQKNKRVNYVEAWVEFAHKSTAKNMAMRLNNSKIGECVSISGGGGKGGRFNDDLWNCKYLSGFKWGDLAEQMAYERKVKDQKLSAEMSLAKKEANFYIKNSVDSKMVNAMNLKKQAKANDNTKPGGNNEVVKRKGAVERVFRQRKVIIESGKGKNVNLKTASSFGLQVFTQ